MQRKHYFHTACSKSLILKHAPFLAFKHVVTLDILLKHFGRFVFLVVQGIKVKELEFRYKIYFTSRKKLYKSELIRVAATILCLFLFLQDKRLLSLGIDSHLNHSCNRN